MKDTLHIEVLRTGDTRLDHVLGGGIPARSINVIAGTPGSGKTVFVMQLVFALAREGKKTLFFTTLSEPAVKLIRYIQAFPFFDEQVLDSLVHFLDVSSVLRTRGMQAALDSLVARVEQEQPTLVVIAGRGRLFGDPARVKGSFSARGLSSRRGAGGSAFADTRYRSPRHRSARHRRLRRPRAHPQIPQTLSTPRGCSFDLRQNRGPGTRHQPGRSRIPRQKPHHAPNPGLCRPRLPPMARPNCARRRAVVVFPRIPGNGPH